MPKSAGIPDDGYTPHGNPATIYRTALGLDGGTFRDLDTLDLAMYQVEAREVPTITPGDPQSQAVWQQPFYILRAELFGGKGH